MGDYTDIINLTRPISKRPRMSLEQRSAQFAPFAALTGYEGQIKETARLTNRRIDIDEEMKLVLDMKLQIIQEKISEKPKLEITYFIPDKIKEGGEYVTITNKINKFNIYNGEIIMLDGTKIVIEEIIDIQGEIFNGINF